MASHDHRVCPSALLPTAPTPHALENLHLFAVLAVDHVADVDPSAVTAVGPVLSGIGVAPGSAPKVLLEPCACLKLSTGLRSGDHQPGLSPPPPHPADVSRRRCSPPA